MEPIIDPIDREILLKELKDGRFIRTTNYGENEIYIINHHNSPNVMREIGRLREVTFREIGEGTNESIDLDKFDKYYHHMFLWDEEAKEIAAFAKSNSLNIQVGFIERFNPAVQALQVVLGKSERLISLDFTRTNKVSARITDVDVITDLMIHDIDLALYLNGPAQSVAAHGFARGDMIDFVSALITHENGRFSRIQASRITDKKIRQIAGTCTDMFVDCDLLRKEILINRHAEEKYEGVLPYAISSFQETVAVPPQESLLSELQAFLASCHGQANTQLPGVEAGVAAMDICEKVHEAVRTGAKTS